MIILDCEFVMYLSICLFCGLPGETKYQERKHPLDNVGVPIGFLKVIFLLVKLTEGKSLISPP